MSWRLLWGGKKEVPRATVIKRGTLWQDIRTFGRSVRGYWTQLAGGSFIAILLSVIVAMGLNIPPIVTGIGAFSLTVILACFFVWREEFHKVQNYEARIPQFVYVDSRIGNRISEQDGKVWAIADVMIRLSNRGFGTAINPKVTFYWCWLDNPADIQTKTFDIVTKTRTYGQIDCPFQIWRLAKWTKKDQNGKTIGRFDEQDEGFAWMELESRANTEDGEKCVYEEQWSFRALTFPKAINRLGLPLAHQIENR